MSKALIFIIILLLIVVPKTDLFDVPGFRQAIRIDDLLTILLLLFCALDNRMRNISLLGHKAGIYFICYLLFSTLIHGLIYGFSIINFVFTIRYLQYFIVGGILYKFASLYPRHAFYIMLCFLLACFLFIPFPGAYAVGRFNAFTRGPWEVGSMIVFFLISILVTRKNNGYIVLSSAIILSLAKARIQLLGFFYYIFTKMGIVYRVV
ncbi:hypothetical protein L1D40_20100, partial [Shewanella insulae]|uniref:hypothetical protein n=1 Tax=Shewanella insulae TaxID=2681496 RepID=UPI001EFDFAC1